MERGIAARLLGSLQSDFLTLVDVAPTNGVDTQGAAGAAFLIAIGAGGSQGVADILLQEATAAITGPFTTIATADLEFPPGSIFTSGDQAIADTDTGVYLIGYHGPGRWIRVEIDNTAGTPDYGVAALVVQGWQRHI